MQILIFKTDVKYKKDVSAVMPYLNNIRDIIKWNFDLSDVDKILRIETNSMQPVKVEQTLQLAGFHCSEL